MLGITIIGIQVMGFRTADSYRFPVDALIPLDGFYGAYGQDTAQDVAERQAEFWGEAVGPDDRINVATVYRSGNADILGQLMAEVGTAHRQGNEIRLSDCAYGCKTCECACGQPHVFHNATYGCPTGHKLESAS